MDLLERKFVNCPSCYSHWATIKYTRTEHLMLRCDECKLLIFANSLDSQDGIYRLCNIRTHEEDISDHYYDEFNKFE